VARTRVLVHAPGLACRSRPAGATGPVRVGRRASRPVTARCSYV